MSDDPESAGKEQAHSVSSAAKAALTIVGGISGFLFLTAALTPIDATLYIHFDRESFDRGMVWGDRLANDIDPENKYKRVPFRIVGYDPVASVEIPEVLADDVEEACVTNEYRWLPPNTKCYEMERIETVGNG